MQPSLNGRRALITGAGAGLGRGIATAMAAAGADCAVWARRDSLAAETANLILAEGRLAHSAGFNLQEDEALEREWAAAAEALGGPIDIVVHNAAVMPVAPIADLPLSQLDLCLDLNLRAAARLSQLAVPGMRQAGKGAILFMSSGMAYYGIAEHATYCATKAGLLGLARGLAMELAPLQVRVNTVSPGTIDSPMLDGYVAEQVAHGVDEQALRDAFDVMHPRGQVGSIAEVANCFVFLASDAAANITGTDLRCDGGLAVKGAQASV
jgi:NAD(P)-dependent dehydrogenase (short-subunit alcohol dehydrogenase family)